MDINYVHSLSWNLASETAKATRLLYDLNNKNHFKHIIVDLGFPLEDDNIPEDIELSQKRNSIRLKKICYQYGSEYLKLPNEGVSPNWTAVFRHLNMDDSDILIGADPDEHPMNAGWVKAMGDVSRGQDKTALVSLMMDIHINLMRNVKFLNYKVNGHRVYRLVEGLVNWALIGISGQFLNHMGEVPTPKGAKMYGWIETAVLQMIVDNGYQWVLLPDYTVHHTDYELGDPGTSRLLREWKNDIIFRIKEIGQPGFEDWLKLKKSRL